MEGEEQSPGGYDSQCIFCRIGNQQESGAQLLHSDEELACFRDIRPGAPHHYLVVPKKHVGNCKTLGNEHLQLGESMADCIVKKMVEVGRNVLQQNQVTNMEDIRLGFHWPPFCSIGHLHLHVLAPASQLGFLSRMIYRLNSYWFITAEQLIERLQANTTS